MLPRQVVPAAHAHMLFKDEPVLSKGMQMLLDYSLGEFVRHPEMPEWGIGQVQSIDGLRVTVNFEHGGKQLINAELVSLSPIYDDIREQS